MDRRGGIRVVGAGEGRHVVAPGGLRSLKATGEDTDGRLTLLEQAVAPGSAARLHLHPYREVFYVLDGELEFRALDGEDEVAIHAGPGTTLDVPPHVAHGYRNAGPDPARFLAIVQPAGAERFLFEVGVEVDDPAVPAALPSFDPAALAERAAAYGIRFVEP